MPNEIQSKDNAQVKMAVRLRESARARREQGLFFLEGWRLCVDALESGYAPEVLYVTETAREKYPVAHENVMIVSEAVAQKLADTQSPQGVFGVFEMQDAGAQELHKCIALENLQDPSNLGAIARTAEALGIDGLIVSGGCDVYHPKALRASMGALLRLNVTQIEDLPRFLRESELPSFAAVPEQDAAPLPCCDFSGGAIVVIGNEGSGLSEEAITACTHLLTIPMRGKSESLNAAAAAAIILWEMCK